MTVQLILWGHALAALLFGAGGLAEWRRRRGGWPSVALTAALGLSALWALAVAGIGPGDLSTRIMEAARNFAWLGFAFVLVRREPTSSWTLSAVYLAVGAVIVASLVLAIAQAETASSVVKDELATAMLVFRMMATAGALVLARHLYGASAGGGIRPIAAALAMMWGADLLLFAAAYAKPYWGAGLVATRGLTVVAVALFLAVSVQRRDQWTLALSRPAATNALIAVALVCYIGLVACLTAVAATLGGEHARALQAGVVIGGAAALLTLISTSWLGAWAKVKLAKHLFQHRYDYRVEWQRFTDTLGTAGEPLERRVISAVARLLDAPAGLLLIADGDRLSASAAWQWDAGDACQEQLAAHLSATRRIIELDAVRYGQAPADAALLPVWMLARDDAWALVPLVHGETLAGAVLLARPPIARALDWEDFDMLRVAGRQAASYLAEDRAGRALAEAQRFEEFNRRFAFILHDIKNLVSQQLLVARNAERHAANPQFRADMVATLKDSADRMTTLLARLSHQDRGPAEPLGPVDLAALAARVARERRAQHAIIVEAAPLWAQAHPQRLEQVLTHLVQNAIEASGDEPVSLKVGRDGERAVVEVADRGHGMSAAFMRDELFRPFSSTKPSGFGIGAFEARQLVTGMDGSLSVESREGEGTCFRIVLPAAPALEKAA